MSGMRWRFVFRHADGSISSRRGFTSRSAATTARRRLLESIDRQEIKPARETFESFWTKLLVEKRPYLSPGSMQDFETHGRKRLLPAFGDSKLAQIDADRVREWLADMVELVEAGELAPKTVNNARTCLSVACNAAVRRGLMPRNPCDDVPPLPLAQEEIDYLRLAEIEPYLDACSECYRPLAETLLGTGARISEAIALRWPDIDLEAGIVRVYRQRARAASGTAPTKGRRFRPVQIGPRLCETLQRTTSIADASASTMTVGCSFVPNHVAAAMRPAAGRHHLTARQSTTGTRRRSSTPGIRDMPLHSLRHTAAASWLSTGHPLMFVQRQLGHRSITTTERHYGHLEQSFSRERWREPSKRSGTLDSRQRCSRESSISVPTAVRGHVANRGTCHRAMLRSHPRRTVVARSDRRDVATE